MERFLESVGLITGTVKNLEEINGECFLKKDSDKALIPNRKEVVKVIVVPGKLVNVVVK